MSVKGKVFMNITCPNCEHQFNLDETEIASITGQIRDAEFEKEVSRRVSELTEHMKISHSQEMKASIAEARLEEKGKASDELAKLQAEIADLKSQLKVKSAETEIALMKEKATLESEFSHKMQVLEDDHRAEVKSLTTELDYYKDLKSRMSTKMIGETLEQHCLVEFDRIRGLMPSTVYFEKDNEVSASGSKGDFIYRETDDEGNEIISIMFEMKNEADATERKHKNEDFFKELDKDRREKSCEYAILVTLLEADNEYYNAGIVDVSRRFEKMYVIRPQFFIPMITILRNAALASADAKRELQRVKNQNIDVTHFEEDLLKFKNAFAYNYNQASKRFNEVLDEIDKSISHMQKIKDSLLACDRQLRLANDKAEDITVKRLCRNNPTMTEQFKKLEDKNVSNDT